MKKKSQKPTPTRTPTYTLLSTIEGGITTAPVLVKFLGKHKSTIYETIRASYAGMDYLIRGIRGEIYPIKKKIFNESYEVLE